MVNHVQKAIDGLRQVRGQLAVELERVDNALAALGSGEARPKQARVTRPCCTKNEVTEIVAKLLDDNPVLTREEIEALAKDKASNDLGKSLSGFAMRLKEALTDPRFDEFEPNKYRLICDGRGLAVED